MKDVSPVPSGRSGNGLVLEDVRAEGALSGGEAWDLRSEGGPRSVQEKVRTACVDQLV